MYRLESGDKQIPASFGGTKLVQDAKKNLNDETIFYVLEKTYTLRPGDNESANKITAYLVLGDEWPKPISLKDANTIFFAVCNNVSPKRNIKITNFSQNRQLYESFEDGDYRELAFVEEDSDAEWEEGEVENVQCFYEGTKIKFKVPVYTYDFVKISKKMKGYAMKKGFPSLVGDNGEEYKIPWDRFGLIVKKRKDGKKFAQCSAENNIIKQTVDNTYQKELIDILNYIGFRIDKNVDIESDIMQGGKAKIFFSDNKFMMVGETPEDPNWVRGVFRPTQNYYVILFKGQYFIYYN